MKLENKIKLKKLMKRLGWLAFIGGLLGLYIFGKPVLQSVFHGSMVAGDNLMGTPWGLFASCLAACMGFIFITKRP